jgi:predicted aspartyl protease
MKIEFALSAAFCFLAGVAAAAGAGIPEVPIELDRNILFVQVKIDGRGPFLAMLDTGTDPSAIDIGLAREFGLSLGRGGAIDGGGTKEETAFETNLDRVEVGSVVARGVEALAGQSIAKIAAFIKRPLKAVLGKSFLSGRIVQIDYPGRTLRFPQELPAEIAPIPGRRAVLAIRYGDDLEMEGVRVDGEPVRAILDTGSNGSLKFTPEAVRRLGLDGRADAGKNSHAMGYRGSYAARSGRVASLALGTVRVENPAAVFWSPGTGHDGKPWEVNVGNAILRRFVVTIDAPGGRLVIETPEKGGE